MTLRSLSLGYLGDRTAGLVLAGVVVLSAGVAQHSLGPLAPVQPAPPQKVSGLVAASEPSSVTIPAAGTIEALLVSAGDDLAAGQPIARLDQSENRDALARVQLDIERATKEIDARTADVEWTRQALARLASGRADASWQLAQAERDAEQVPVRQAKDSPERAQVAYDQAVARLHRAEQLSAAGLVARQEVDDARFAVQLATDDLANARRAADAARRVRAAEARQVRAQREQAAANLQKQLGEATSALDQAELRLKVAQLSEETLQSALAHPFLLAPRPGAVVELPAHAGDRLAAGALVARIASMDPLDVAITVEPSLVNTVHVGDPALVDVPSAGVRNVQGHVRAIDPLPGDDGNYGVRVSLPNPSHARLAGQAAAVLLQHPAGGSER